MPRCSTAASLPQFVALYRGWRSVEVLLYRVICKFLLDFRPLRYSSRDSHAEGEHVNRGRDTSSFCPTLQVLDMSTLGNAADVNPVIKFLPHTTSLSVSQRTGSHCAGISCTTHELFCSQVVLCGILAETSVAPSQLTHFWQIPRHRTLPYCLSTPCFVTTAPQW